MTRIEEVQAKLERVRNMMAEEELGAVVLGGQGSFAWITAGGDCHVVMGSERGVAMALITADNYYVVTDNIEAGRIGTEEVAGLGFEVVADEWHKNNLNDLINDLAPGDVAADGNWLPGAIDLGDSLAELSWELLPAEVERYRALGAEVSDCLGQACREIEPGWTEFQIGALLSQKLRCGGIHPLVILIAVDKRIRRFRHPIPTAAKLERYAMLVASVRRGGLIASATRLVHFGALDRDLRQRHDACVKVDACFNLATKPGATAAQVFAKAIRMYAETGYPDEWRLHHQGGATGYQGRSYKATATTPYRVLANQAFAWNPSIAGTKSEDTILATPDGPEVLTPAADWPMIEVEYGGRSMPRPDMLVR
jgi:Xaa-Pro dipeptidase